MDFDCEGKKEVANNTARNAQKNCGFAASTGRELYRLDNTGDRGRGSQSSRIRCTLLVGVTSIEQVDMGSKAYPPADRKMGSKSDFVERFRLAFLPRKGSERLWHKANAGATRQPAGMGRRHPQVLQPSAWRSLARLGTRQRFLDRRGKSILQMGPSITMSSLLAKFQSFLRGPHSGSQRSFSKGACFPSKGTPFGATAVLTYLAKDSTIYNLNFSKNTK